METVDFGSWTNRRRRGEVEQDKQADRAYIRSNGGDNAL